MFCNNIYTLSSVSVNPHPGAQSCQFISVFPFNPAFSRPRLFSEATHTHISSVTINLSHTSRYIRRQHNGKSLLVPARLNRLRRRNRPAALREERRQSVLTGQVSFCWHVTSSVRGIKHFTFLKIYRGWDFIWHLHCRMDCGSVFWTRLEVLH